MNLEKQRLDQIVVDRGWSESRAQARALIMAGKVWQGTERLTKPGLRLSAESELRLESPPRFVGRGAEKLEGFLEKFEVDVAGAACLDVGASTGGFTDCLLQRGAAGVTCVDVGRAQLHPRLLADPRVINLERINARYLKAGDLPLSEYVVIVIDVSFISLRHILPAVWPFLAPEGFLIALVKPQFEAGREVVSRGRGVIRDPTIQKEVFDGMRMFGLSELPHSRLIGEMDSPLKGADGNREGLIGWRKARSPMLEE